VRVWQALRALDDDWRVFHSVPWQSVRDGREGDGEADFVLLHPRKGVVVLEVKGGEIAIHDGVWYSRHRGTGDVHRIKNPFEQAKASKYALLRYLEAAVPGGFPGSVSHGAILPDVTVGGRLSLDSPREIIWDATDLLDPVAALDRLVVHWGARASLSPSELKTVTQLLAPTTAARSGLRAQVAGALQEQLQLTNMQIRTLDGLRRNRQGVIMGSAGTGKTVLAVERARRLATESFNVLLVCYNRPLADHISAELRDEPLVTVSTFHSLCLSEMSAAGMEPPMDPPRSWWEREAAETLAVAVDATGRRYDALVVDEGQDFNASWLAALQLLLTSGDDAPIALFADTLQALFDRDWNVPPEWPIFELDVNCRNTRQIATRVSGLVGQDIPTLGAEGPKPQYVTVRDEADMLATLPDIVDGLLSDEDFEAEECVVLVGPATLADQIRNMTTETTSFVTVGKHGVGVETISRFKGLESHVVFISLLGIDLASEKGRALGYVGMSRARALLFVFGTKEQREALAWGIAGSS
jgi:hypothetical protein